MFVPLIIKSIEIIFIFDLFALGVPALVQSKGHIIDGVSEFPLVVSDETQKLTKTKQAVALLRRLRIWADIQKVNIYIISITLKQLLTH